MAISFGATSEQLLRGIDRIIASMATLLPARVSAQVAIPKAWASARGETIVQAQIDISGGFPGSLRSQHRIRATQLHLTESWLIVGEGTAAGFALPLNRLQGSSVQTSGGLQPPSLVLWYQDGELAGSFQISFRGTARNRTGMLRAEWLQQQLGALGIAAIDSGAARFMPNVHCTWDAIDEHVDDEILFSGRALASAGGLFADQLDLADVWVSERSLIWCPAHGTGVNRLALDAVVQSRNGFGDRLAIGIEDACGGRYDLYFDLGVEGDRTKPAARVQQLLAAHGIPIGIAAQPVAPWRSGGTRRPDDI